jgi:hypothetical protein
MSAEPCLCGDPLCPRCFPGATAHAEADECEQLATDMMDAVQPHIEAIGRALGREDGSLPHLLDEALVAAFDERAAAILADK